MQFTTSYSNKILIMTRAVFSFYNVLYGWLTTLYTVSQPPRNRPVQNPTVKDLSISRLLGISPLYDDKIVRLNTADIANIKGKRNVLPNIITNNNLAT